MNKYMDLFVAKARARIGKGEGKVTQEELTKILGLKSNSGISRLLNGKRGTPTLDTVETMEKALGYKPGEMLNAKLGIEDTKPSPSDALDDLSQRIRSGDAAVALVQLVFPGITPITVRELLRLRTAEEWEGVELALLHRKMLELVETQGIDLKSALEKLAKHG